ncbi:uncharacterized protein LOC117181551 isoform X2 [Belonocnema kinseyi]|uniref:uncharacterized protein LOC117181551 isoform X2 n=1 Tax=Belonocnema kinseyi TaxID=2817044 RepID=UPI00143DBFA1|nr:uncharacterized protein LOC117181551 isoform X2 [Belonocnema kinseyi]XP_033230262.1 uncharacterized protein LOC117181551 isoform X2 [Belonocnema kinseyi]XP_033230263.1 uncharacterized protein LOC117181551 isoform X2 [Belonocnema kinseyi]
MMEPAKKIVIGDNSISNNLLVPTTNKVDCSYIRAAFEILKLLQQEIRTRFQRSKKITAVYVVPTNDLDVSTANKLDFSYLRTTSGILKLLQQIYIVFIAAISYFCSFYPAYAGEYCYEDDSDHRTCLNERGIFLYKSAISFILFICLPAIHILMWAYVLHKVEKWTNYSWQVIEYTICSSSAIMCFLASTFPLARLHSEMTIESSILSIFILVPDLLFMFDICLLRKKQKMNLQLKARKLQSILTIEKT